MKVSSKLAILAVTTAVVLWSSGAPANSHASQSANSASATQPSGPYCPDRAITPGVYSHSYIGPNFHHYDVWFLPTGWATVDCDV